MSAAPDTLVRVTIDGRAVQVPPGTLVTDAARRAEVAIPIFCSHAKLPPLGACRICLVEIGLPKRGRDGAPVLGADGAPEIAWMPKPQTACTTPVAEGMVVATASAGATRARQGVMEFLLVNHPLDCPVCDEGGECQLQDLAFAFGHDASRMDEPKRTFVSESLGPIVKKEANRCIVCMRCVRYCDEVMGEDALTAHQRGVHTEISSFDRQPLACEQCGNCVEVCPVGALTALPYRFRARPWDLRQHVTICPWCSNGCSVRLGVRGSEILRARGTERRGVNQEFLCVRGRFGYEFVNHPERLGAPLIRVGGQLQPAGFEEAVTFAAGGLQAIARRHGPQAIAFLGGENLNVEEQYLFQKLARAVLGTNHVDARTRHTAPVTGDAVLRATGGGRPAPTFEQLVRAEEALVLFEDLQAEGPLAQASLIRGQHQHGVHLTVAHARRVKLARAKFGGAWLAVRAGGELALVHALTRAVLDERARHPEPAPLDPAHAAALATLARALPAVAESEAATGVAADQVMEAGRRLLAATRKAIVFGRNTAQHPEAQALLQAIENLGWASGAITAGRSSVMFLGAKHDSQGALDMGLVPDRLPGYVPLADRDHYGAAWGATLPGEPGLTAPEILRAAADGRIRALWIAGDHWLRSAPDRALAERALANAELVIVSEMFLTSTARAAHVVFPAAAFAEKEGVTVNCERRPQRTARAVAPRPGARPDWQIFQAVARALGAAWNHRTAEDVYREIARLVPGYRGTSWATLVPLGSPWAFEPARVVAPAFAASHDGAPPAGEGLWLLAGGMLFLQGSLSHRTEILPQLAHEPRAWLHPAEAARLGAIEGAPVELHGPSGRITLRLGLDDAVPEGGVFVPDAQVGVELNRLGSPSGAGLRVRVQPAGARAAAPSAAERA
ncbi:MAG TPA: NADH-quinone oxidoreductase subunit NuoG [Candidatus Eisenbacteria bacterium]|nr:NADH-quinone oxidoreductase subunit NuoG [Candidatus Eisenbacteria bacterium]